VAMSYLYDTVLGDRGRYLSGGQRSAIERAFPGRPADLSWTTPGSAWTPKGSNTLRSVTGFAELER
jgi:ABC-type protease/lipase transport system fused ATPase/permease subunit